GTAKLPPDRRGRSAIARIVARMAVLLFVIGGLSVVAGAALTAFGFSIELSFGNSLIVVGVTALVGDDQRIAEAELDGKSLIVAGVTAAVAQLRRIAELLGRSDLPRPSSS